MTIPPDDTAEPDSRILSRPANSMINHDAQTDWVTACTDLGFAWGKPEHHGMVKLHDADFTVQEELGFAPDGNGEHLFLQIEKHGLGTLDVQQLLARHFKLPVREVSFSGMKDRNAVTTQWFSVRTGAHAGAGERLATTESVRVITACRNSRKLRRGTHKSNHFRITVRNVSGLRATLQECLDCIQHSGVPNYFGPQRFGNGCSNLLQVASWFAGQMSVRDRTRRSMLLSSARSFLFNQVLSQRVLAGDWNSALKGDVMALAGSGSTFAEGRATADELATRLAAFDIHPTGPLWGRGSLSSTGEVARLEQHTAECYSNLAAGLVEAGLIQERRPLRLQVENLNHAMTGTDLLLEFTLPRGAFATAVLRELIHTDLQ